MCPGGGEEISMARTVGQSEMAVGQKGKQGPGHMGPGKSVKGEDLTLERET